MEPIKRDLKISDTQVSLLQGFVFALFMAGAGLPIGRLVDTGRRTAIVAGGVLVWGVMTMGCGLASNFAGLLVLRMGVGVGEAALTPSVRAALRFFAAHRASMGLINLTGAFTAMSVYAAAAWVPSVFIRAFHWTASGAGLAYGLLVIPCGAAGVLAGGVLGDRVVARGHASGRVIVMGVAAARAAPFACLAPLAASSALCLVLLAPATLLSTMSLGLLPSVQQAIAPNHLRGSTSALGILTVNLLGLGLEPTLIALATDDLFRNPAAVGRSLALLSPIMLLFSAACAAGCLGAYAKTVAVVRLPAGAMEETGRRPRNA